MGTDGEFDIAPRPRNEGEGGFGLTSGGELMICANAVVKNQSWPMPVLAGHVALPINHASASPGS